MNRHGVLEDRATAAIMDHLVNFGAYRITPEGPPMRDWLAKQESTDLTVHVCKS